jgi:hypothetical protein
MTLLLLKPRKGFRISEAAATRFPSPLLLEFPRCALSPARIGTKLLLTVPRFRPASLKRERGSKKSQEKTCRFKRGLGWLTFSSDDHIKPFANFLGARPGHLPYYFAVAHENKSWPKLDLKRSAERLSFAIFDHDVSDAWIFLKKSRQLRPECAAEASPFRAEFDKNRPLHPVDFFPGRLPILVWARQLIRHTLFLSSQDRTGPSDYWPLLEAYYHAHTVSNRSLASILP